MPMKPSGWPTCRPEPLGYGNMSSTNSFGRAGDARSGSASGPAGFGVSNVPLLVPARPASAARSPARARPCTGALVRSVGRWPGASLIATAILRDVPVASVRSDAVRAGVECGDGVRTVDGRAGHGAGACQHRRCTVHRRRSIDRLVARRPRRPGSASSGRRSRRRRRPAFVSWAQIHDEARAVGAALQARGLGARRPRRDPRADEPRSLITIIQGCWLAGIASMVLPLPMRMGSLEAFIESTRGRIRHGDAKLVLIDDLLAAFYEAGAGRPADRADAARCCPARPDVPSGERLEMPAHDPERLVILQYTSGSTSEPKGVMIPDRVLTANIDASCAAAELEPATR